MRGNPKDLTGIRYGRLTAIEFVGHKNAARLWRCKCECGSEAVVTVGNLNSGHTQSCGCSTRTHRMSNSATYRSWRAMFTRCTNASDGNFRYWGGRGITVCERWRSFENFLADMGVRPSGKTLDRKDNDGNYEPGNCRWATPSQQTVNSRSWGGLRDIDDNRISMREAAEALAISQHALRWLLIGKRKWGWRRPREMRRMAACAAATTISTTT